MTPPEPPPGSPESKPLWATGQELARAALAELSSGADQLREAGLRSPPPTARVRSFVHGFALPFLIARRLWRTPGERRPYLKVVLWQLTVTLAICLGLALLSEDWREDVDPPERLRERAEVFREEGRRLTGLAQAPDSVLLPHIQEQVLRVRQEEAAEAKPEVLRQAQAAKRASLRAAEAARQAAAARGTAQEAQAAQRAGELKQEEAEARAESEAAMEAARQADAAVQQLLAALPGLQSQAPAEPSKRGKLRIGGGPDGKGVQIRFGEQEEPSAVEGEQTAPEPVETLAREVAASEREDLAEEETDPDRLEVFRRALTRAAEGQQRHGEVLEKRAAEIERAGGLLIHRTLLFWAVVFSLLYVVQTLVIWLSREFHDQIESRASRLIGMPPEELVEHPKVRLNLRWMRKKLKRRWRALFVFGTGLPLIYLVTAPVPWLSPVLSALWFAYWWVVWSAARTSYAWTEPPGDPWYLSAWTHLTTHVLLFRWAGPRAYGRLWRRFTQSVFAPAACFEKQPWTMAGLGLARGIGSIPVIKIFLRPFFPLASAVLIEERRGRLFTTPEVVEPVLTAELLPPEAPDAAGPDDPEPTQ
ncbi:MAG: hypothetical protein M3Y59_20650 [Myxococcota bacterium]|nr:hypothetical protein [Myxococcota bacterium]